MNSSSWQIQSPSLPRRVCFLLKICTSIFLKKSVFVVSQSASWEESKQTWNLTLVLGWLKSRQLLQFAERKSYFLLSCISYLKGIRVKLGVWSHSKYNNRKGYRMQTFIILTRKIKEIKDLTPWCSWGLGSFCVSRLVTMSISFRAAWMSSGSYLMGRRPLSMEPSRSTKEPYECEFPGHIFCAVQLQESFHVLAKSFTCRTSTIILHRRGNMAQISSRKHSGFFYLWWATFESCCKHHFSLESFCYKALGNEFCGTDFGMSLSIQHWYEPRSLKVHEMQVGGES